MVEKLGPASGILIMQRSLLRCILLLKGYEMRRKFSNQFKAKIALEALRGDKTIQEIASKYQLHPNQESWSYERRQFSNIN